LAKDLLTRRSVDVEIIAVLVVVFAIVVAAKWK
jgi:hypothetical protein